MAARLTWMDQFNLEWESELNLTVGARPEISSHQQPLRDLPPWNVLTHQARGRDVVVLHVRPLRVGFR